MLTVGMLRSIIQKEKGGTFPVCACDALQHDRWRCSYMAENGLFYHPAKWESGVAPLLMGACCMNYRHHYIDGPLWSGDSGDLYKATLPPEKAFFTANGTLNPPSLGSRTMFWNWVGILCGVFPGWLTPYWYSSSRGHVLLLARYIKPC